MQFMRSLFNLRPAAPRYAPEAKYRLGASSNLFSGVLPEGVYFPDYTTLEDYRPLEFVALAEQALGKPWRQCTVLDLGCGEGTSSAAIGRTGARVIGIEGRPDVLARAQYLRDRLGYTNVEFRGGSVLDPALWEQADAVYATGLIHHLENPFQLMELAARFCSDLVYFCTHLAPADEAHRARSFFSQLLHEAGTVEYNGQQLAGIHFLEGHDVREEASGRRRNPRAGIGNAHSWWPSEASFVAGMAQSGFPVWRRLAAHDYRLRYRLAFRRHGEIPAPGQPGRGAFWDGPQRPHPETAVERSLAADIAFLRREGIAPAIAGTPAAIERVRARLGAAGIRPSLLYATDGAAPGAGVPVAPLERLAQDGPEFVVIAATRFADLKSQLAELVTLRACRYAFTSFTLPEIEEFPPLLDPVIGEPVASGFASRLTY